MKSKIRERQTIAGDYSYIEYYPVFEIPSSGGKRKNKYKATSAQQQHLNERNSRIKLEQTIHTNFDDTSYTIHPTYDDAFLPLSDKCARHDMQNYIRRIRRIFEAAGLDKDALKYIYVTQYGEQSGRCHHHIIISGGVPREKLIEAWGMGRVNVDNLQFNESGVADLAEYIGREGGKKKKSPMPEVWKKRWCGSKNLKKPKVKTRDNVIRRKDIKYIDDNCYEKSLVTVACRKTIEDRYEGYTLNECEVIRNEINNGVYVRMKLYRTESPLLAWRKTLFEKAKKGERQSNNAF